LSKEKYIIASCVIFSNSVYKDGKKIFEQKATDLHTFLTNAYTEFAINYPKFYKMDTLSKLGWLASEALLSEQDVREKYQPEDVGILFCNANASLDVDFKYYNSVADIASPALFVYTLPNIMIGEICIRNGFKGENGFFIFDSFDAAFIESYVGNLLDRNISKICICGWVDVIAEEYKAAMFLIGTEKTGMDILFNKENLINIFSGEES
jgi:hypothetical protein